VHNQTKPGRRPI